MYNKEKIINVMKEIYEESKSIAPYVVVAQPRRSKSELAAQKFDGYQGIHINFDGFSHGFCDIDGEKVDVARNYLIEQALQSGAKYLMFIGEDTVVPFDAFQILHRTAEENPGTVVAGVYYIKLSDAMIMVKKDDWIVIPNVDPGQLIEAHQTGMDCMLIPIEILKSMKEEAPDIPFCCIGNNIGDMPFIGEDNFFVYRLRKRGTKLLVNTDVQCIHMDLASGKYTAHPSVNPKVNYYTQIPITDRLKPEDKEYIDKRWFTRIPKGSSNVAPIIETLIKENKPIKLNMGSGDDRPEGFLNIDLYNTNADIKQDITELSLPSNCADEILASHVVEHIHRFKIAEVLASWCDILKPKGKLMLELPDLEGLCKQFINASDEERYAYTICIYGVPPNLINEVTVKNGTASPHVWGYYPKILKDLLIEAGFSDVKVMNSQTGHPGINFRIEAIK